MRVVRVAGLGSHWKVRNEGKRIFLDFNNPGRYVWLTGRYVCVAH